MTSYVLPLATLKVVQSPNQSSPKKLGLSIHAPIGFSSFGYRVLSPALRVCSNSSVIWNFNPIVAVPKPDFLVRSGTDSNSSAEAEASENELGTLSVTVQDVYEAETESKLEDPKMPKQPRVKLGEIMRILNRRAIEEAGKERPTPDLRTGDIVEIKWAVPENKRRFSIYRGIVISKQNAGIHTTIRIRRIIAGIGVEIVFPIYSPNLKEIRVVNHRKVRRARLYYLRDKLPRFSTFKW